MPGHPMQRLPDVRSPGAGQAHHISKRAAADLHLKFKDCHAVLTELRALKIRMRRLGMTKGAALMPPVIETVKRSTDSAGRMALSFKSEGWRR